MEDELASENLLCIVNIDGNGKGSIFKLFCFASRRRWRTRNRRNKQIIAIRAATTPPAIAPGCVRRAEKVDPVDRVGGTGELDPDNVLVLVGITGGLLELEELLTDIGRGVVGMLDGVGDTELKGEVVAVVFMVLESRNGYPDASVHDGTGVTNVKKVTTVIPPGCIVVVLRR